MSCTGRWLAFGLLVWALPAGAQQPRSSDEQARVHFEAGASYLDDGDYELAIREFQRAYDLSHRPGLLYNLYVANERAGHLAPAIDFLARYLHDGGSEIENRDSLERRLQRLRERQANGETTIVSPTGPTTTTGGGGGDLPIPALSVLIAGGAGLVNFAIFAALAAGEDGSLSARCGHSCTPADVQTLNTFDLVADISLVAGLVLAAGGAVLWIVLPSGGGGSRTAQLQLTPWATAQSAGLSIGGRL